MCLRRFCFPILLVITVVAFSTMIFSQATISTGNINGTVTDPSGAVVSGAKVTITNRETGQAIVTNTNPSGFYTSGTLNPGNYSVRVEAPGFKTIERPVTVQVNMTANGNMKLEVGQSSQVVQ